MCLTEYWRARVLLCSIDTRFKTVYVASGEHLKVQTEQWARFVDLVPKRPDYFVKLHMRIMNEMKIMRLTKALFVSIFIGVFGAIAVRQSRTKVLQEIR
jgi:hypothetical protein